MNWRSALAPVVLEGLWDYIYLHLMCSCDVGGDVDTVYVSLSGLIMLTLLDGLGDVSGRTLPTWSNRKRQTPTSKRDLLCCLMAPGFCHESYSDS